MNIDPDILAVLEKIAGTGERLRVAQVTKKHEQQLEDRFQTQLELLADEVEQVIPKDHPLFNMVLMSAAIRKALRSQQEPEFRSFLDEGLPNPNW